MALPLVISAMNRFDVQPWWIYLDQDVLHIVGGLALNSGELPAQAIHPGFFPRIIVAIWLHALKLFGLVPSPGMEIFDSDPEPMIKIKTLIKFGHYLSLFISVIFCVSCGLLVRQLINSKWGFPLAILLSSTLLGVLSQSVHLKTEIYNRLINSKDTSIETHLDKEYEIKSTADWKKLFNSEIMDKYKNTLSRITRSCQALNIEDEITQDSVNKSLVKENNVKGLLCGKDDYYLIDVKNEKVKHSSSKRVDWTGMIEEEKTTGYRWWNTDPNTISFWFGYVEGNKYLPAYKYTINRKTLSLKVDYCADMDNFVEQLACFSPNPQIIKCEAFTSEKLLMKWENEIRKRTEDNKI